MAGYFYSQPPVYTGGPQPYGNRKAPPPSGPTPDSPPLRVAAANLAIIVSSWSQPYTVPQLPADFVPQVQAPATQPPPSLANLRLIVDQWQPAPYWIFGPDGLAPFATPPQIDAPPPLSRARLQTILSQWVPQQTQQPPLAEIAPLLSTPVASDNPPPTNRALARMIVDSWLPPAYALPDAPSFVPQATVTPDAPPPSGAVTLRLIRESWTPAPYTLPEAGTFAPLIAPVADQPPAVSKATMRLIVDSWRSIGAYPAQSGADIAPMIAESGVSPPTPAVFGLSPGSVHSILTTTGKSDWRYLDGDDGSASIPIAFAQPPDIRGVQEGTTPTYSIIDYVTAPPGAVITLNVGTTFGGWTYNGTTSITYGGSTQATNVLRTTVSYLGIPYTSPYSFIVETVASASADATPPTIPTRFALAAIPAQGVQLSFYPGCDPLVTTALGISGHQVVRDGVTIHTISSAAGISPKLVGVDLGAVDGAGSTTQGSGATGANYSVVSNGAGLGGSAPSAEAGHFAYEQVSGTQRVIFLINNLAGADANRSVIFNVRESLDPSARGVFFRINSTSMLVRRRTTFAAATSSVGSSVAVTWPRWFEITWNAAGDFSFAHGADKDNLSALTTTTVALSAFYAGIFEGTGGTGIAVTGDIQQYCRQTLDPVIYVDPILDGASHAYNVKSTDSLNLSASTATLSITAPTSGVDTTPDQFTFTDQTGVALSSTVTSAAITVGGINSPSAITITGGTYDINTSGTFAGTAGTVNNGDTVRVRHTASGSNSTAVNTVLSIGGVSDTFTSSTLASGGVTIPAEPTSLAAVGLTTNTLRITFTPSAGATRERLYLSTSPTGPFTQATGDPVITGSPFDFFVGGSPNTTWYCQMSAMNAAGESTHSTVFSGTTLASTILSLQEDFSSGIATPAATWQTNSNTSPGNPLHVVREVVDAWAGSPKPKALRLGLDRLTDSDYRVQNNTTAYEAVTRSRMAVAFSVLIEAPYTYTGSSFVYQAHHNFSGDPWENIPQVPLRLRIGQDGWLMTTIFRTDRYNTTKFLPNTDTTNYNPGSILGDAFHAHTPGVWTRWKFVVDWNELYVGYTPGTYPGNLWVYKNAALVANINYPIGYGLRKTSAGGTPSVLTKYNLSLGIYCVGDPIVPGHKALYMQFADVRGENGPNAHLLVD